MEFKDPYEAVRTLDTEKGSYLEVYSNHISKIDMKTKKTIGIWWYEWLHENNGDSPGESYIKLIWDKRYDK